MQATQTHTLKAIQALRTISEHSVYRIESTRPIREPQFETVDTAGNEIEAWARRAGQANGFGGT